MSLTVPAGILAAGIPARLAITVNTSYAYISIGSNFSPISCGSFGTVGPTVPKLPHEIGEKLDPMEMYAYDVLTVIANLAGIPAGSIPAGTVNDIPVGLQIQAKPLDDEKIIKAMSVFENIQ